MYSRIKLHVLFQDTRNTVQDYMTQPMFIPKKLCTFLSAAKQPTNHVALFDESVLSHGPSRSSFNNWRPTTRHEAVIAYNTKIVYYPIGSVKGA